MEISSNIEDRALDIKNYDCQKLGCQSQKLWNQISNMGFGIEKKKK